MRQPGCISVSISSQLTTVKRGTWMPARSPASGWIGLVSLAHRKKTRRFLMWGSFEDARLQAFA
ncbi:hypothetical protein AWB78_04909 [Caballeronia calidae]|uniref:Uncharacterized protein n=1 Tax=Caballeronia calidae TaxID=1777139 RepID=A0A158DA01_9BURK|nr:hypothetical protein AWB78_04909 [Caballeronia calidae]